MVVQPVFTAGELPGKPELSLLGDKYILILEKYLIYRINGIKKPMKCRNPCHLFSNQSVPLVFYLLLPMVCHENFYFHGLIKHNK
jgi:hypothetical protein